MGAVISQDYARPDSLDEALDLLARREWAILAGGTDFYPQLADKKPSRPILDITAISGLRGVNEDTDAWRIGAATTWADLIASELPAAFDGLKLAAREVGSVQIQNRASIAGNLCTASPAGDGIPPLLTLEAEVELACGSGLRRVGLSDFIDGYRSTVLSETEMITAILVPKSAATGRSHFVKLGARRYLVISIAMVAVRLELEDRRIRKAAIAVGACSPVAKRLGALERDLVGASVSNDFAALVTDRHLADLSPIDDARATAEYRLGAVPTLIARSLRGAIDGAGL